MRRKFLRNLHSVCLVWLKKTFVCNFLCILIFRVLLQSPEQMAPPEQGKTPSAASEANGASQPGWETVVAAFFFFLLFVLLLLPQQDVKIHLLPHSSAVKIWRNAELQVVRLKSVCVSVWGFFFWFMYVFSFLLGYVLSFCLHVFRQILKEEENIQKLVPQSMLDTVLSLHACHVS